MTEIKDMTFEQLMSLLKDANASEEDKQAAEWYLAIKLRASQRESERGES